MKNNLKILITDDNKHFLNAFKYVLLDEFQDNISEIFLAQNGNECLDILEKEVIDVVFLDVEMPRIGGATLTRMICERYREVVVVAVSFHDDISHITQMIDAGARYYVSKEDVNKKQLEAIFQKQYA